MKLRIVLLAAAAALALTPAAAAHVTLNPPEWEAGGFARFAVRVPNERPKANTTKITMQFPESVVQASFQPVSGWKRTVEMARLDEPIEEEGEEPITERIATVTWSGGTIRPGEFQEFGISFQVPETVGEDLLFPSLQTYSSGEIVRWISPDPEAEEPAPRVTVVPPEEEGGGGAGAATEAQPAEPAPAAASEDGGRENLALGFGIGGLILGAAALGVALLRPRRSVP